MDKGDIAAWVAALIAMGAAWIAMHNANSARTQAGAALKQAAEAEKARVAAEESAAEARKANEFAREKDAREQAERAAAEVAEASKVRVELRARSSLWVEVTNHGAQTVFDLALNKVVPSADPSWRWKFGSRAVRLGEIAPALQPEETKKWPVLFVSDTDEQKRFVGDSYDVTYSFTDGNGQRWRRSGDGAPERVADAVDSPPDKSQAPTAPTEDDIKFQLLDLIVERDHNHIPIDVPLLHEELGLDEVLVQQCLDHLHEEGLIRAMRGDDHVVAIEGPTPGGVRLVEGREL
ncbi:hypothetical protein Lesp02_03580 [Lentzea sp. NBRC 105346]|uniref:hypothetical protein n=1 Tax=Lentzea sp. NBRC 105346 TaxID=3032205 RepID=UPI0024A0B8B3|nr:hypothetical protein [Lentzea sp. NBRC 105346]GLZ28168.1 hypothetical protein Lesp02_03580 [Lentzea sp. NBRC 105346]